MSITKEKRYESVGVISVALLILYLYLYWNGKERIELIWISATILFLGLFIAPAGDGINFLWSKLSEALGWLSSKIVLSVLFFLFLTPIALLYRMFSKDRLKWKKQKGTYYIERTYEYKKEDLKNLF